MSGPRSVWQMVKNFSVYPREVEFFNQFTLDGQHTPSPQKPSENVDNDLCCGIGDQCLSTAEQSQGNGG